MAIHVNRILNLKKIKAIGLDMDHTLIRYHSQNFERLTFNEMVRKLVTYKNYPKEIEKIPFEFERAIRGLIIDKLNGNLVKLSLYGRVRMAYHGYQMLEYKEMNRRYRGNVIDLNDPDYQCIDTSFSLGEAILYQGLIEFKKNHPDLLPASFVEIADDVHEVLDLSHRDGALKGAVRKDLVKYIICDQEVPEGLESLKKAGKKLMLITNSDFHYSKMLLDHSINPFLQEYKNWMELFDIVITYAAKPSFFGSEGRFLKINPEDGTMTNYEQKVTSGIFQGGNATSLQESLGLHGEEILYVGDHIYGDILQLKKKCAWRTALVLEELDDEVESLKRMRPLIEKIDKHMAEKENLESQVRAFQQNKKKYKKELHDSMEAMRKLDDVLSTHIEQYQKTFNPYWGEVMRAGQEESRIMGQISKYACIYMSKISDFQNVYPNHYFRPKRRPLPHDPF